MNLFSSHKGRVNHPNEECQDKTKRDTAKNNCNIAYENSNLSPSREISRLSRLRSMKLLNIFGREIIESGQGILKILKF